MIDPLNLVVTVGGVPVRNQADGIEAFKDACLASKPTPHQPGIWTLTAPDGRTWQADSPLKCAGLEQHERVPPSVAMARIREALRADGYGDLADRLGGDSGALPKEPT